MLDRYNLFIFFILRIDNNIQFINLLAYLFSNARWSEIQHHYIVLQENWSICSWIHESFRNKWVPFHFCWCNTILMREPIMFLLICPENWWNIVSRSIETPYHMVWYISIEIMRHLFFYHIWICEQITYWVTRTCAAHYNSFYIFQMQNIPVNLI